MIKFYDTSSLLLMAEHLFENKNDTIVISSITLQELEHIKVSINKDSHIKYIARKLLHVLDENNSKFICHIYKDYMIDCLKKQDLEINNDMRILGSAIDYQEKYKIEDFYFYTNDLSLKMIATIFLKPYQILSVNENNEDDYSGYLEIQLEDEEMAEFYSDSKTYGKNLQILTNQYLNIYNADGDRVDTLCWTGENFRQLSYNRVFSSKQLGEIKPFKGDIYQAMVADSLTHNKITIIKGSAGTGKSHLALGYLFSLLEKGKINQIVIFCNTVATKNSAKLGFYPGSKNEKLLDSQIGNFLASKLGGTIGVEQLIDENKLILLPMSDIRGYDTSGMNAGIYITEAQNLDVELLKLALQRVGEDSIVILDGDTKSQVDLIDYEGYRNGMRRASQVFRGKDIYGEIELKKIHRSRIAEIANLM